MSSPTYVLGIDPGKTGAVAVLKDGELYFVCKAPLRKTPKGHDYDILNMRNILRTYAKSGVLYIEKAGPFRVQGRTQGGVSMFNYGAGYGLWLGIAAGIGLRTVEVRPQQWKQAVLKKHAHDKAASIDAFKKAFPNWSLTPGRKSVPDHNLAEAALIAVYGGMKEWT